MAMDIGDAKLTVKAEDKTQAAFKSVDKSTGKMTANFKKAGLAMTAVGVGLALALGKMVNSYSKAGDEIAKMAKRTGFSTVALSEMKHVAKITGTELGSIEKATKKMSKSLIDADRGLETYVRSFEELGLDIQALRAQKPEEQFWTIANAIGDLKDHTLKAAIAQEIFGRAGTELLPMLSETKEGITALRQEAHDLGVVYDTTAAEACEAFEDAKSRLKTAFQGISNAIAETIMPKLSEFIETLVDKMQPAIAWLKKHPEITGAFTKLGVALGALCIVGGPILLLLGYLPQMIAGFMLLKTAIMTTLIPALVKATLAFIAMLAVMGPWGWAALIGGIAAAGAAIAGLASLGLIGGAPKKRPPRYAPGTEPGVLTPAAATKMGTLLPPSMQYGGIVPGPIGRPVPIIAHGGEPFGGMGGLRSPINIYLTVEGSVVTEEDLISRIREGLIHIKDRNTSVW